MSHAELVERAMNWLASRRCAPIFNNCASCAEIPDAIGWSSSYKHRGSLVIECKASRSDFYADKKKRFRWKAPDSETLINWAIMVPVTDDGPKFFRCLTCGTETRPS